MPYYRRPYKRARYGKKLKYSVQQKCITVTTPDESNTGKVEVVPGTDVEGMRKVKHLTVSMSPDTTDTLSFYWALVYVPQGTTPGDINISGALSASMYEPNQFVMNCGIMSSGAGPIRISSLSLATSTMGTLSTFLSGAHSLSARPSTIVLCVTLSPSSDHHITPQISIASKFVGPVDVRSPNTPSGRVILSPPFLIESC